MTIIIAGDAFNVCFSAEGWRFGADEAATTPNSRAAEIIRGRLSSREPFS